jgi:hypothetical protein
MSRLSLWKDGTHSNDYKFFDRRISEMFTIGGTGVLLNKYLGAGAGGGIFQTVQANQTGPDIILQFSSVLNVAAGMFVYGAGIPTGTKVTQISGNLVTLSLATTSAILSGTSIGFSADATKPAYPNTSAQNIQDLLYLENRDRKYDPDVYKMRGIYQRADQDFDLSQFGLFLQTGTIFMTFHLRDMVDQIGRKLIAGDVLELQHLKDFDALNQDVPAALKRYYVVGDASFASEGFSPTWWPHLWRVKLNPLVDSQEYQGILNIISANNGTGGNATPISQIVSTYNTFMNINDAIVTQAEIDVPKSGYDTGHFYTLPTDLPDANPVSDLTADHLSPTADTTGIHADRGSGNPTSKIEGYLTGDGLAPNRVVTGAGIAFPPDPTDGDFFLRLDYLPNRLFRFNSTRWVKIEDNVRTGLTPGATDNLTQRSSYVNNTNTYVDANGTTRNELQPLSKILNPKADN